MPRWPEKSTRTDSDRARDSEAAQIAAGGVRKTVLLSPEAAAALPALQRKHGVTTFKALVERLLLGR